MRREMSLNLETFISPSEDWEINQYRVLAGIKEFRSELNRKKIYPVLAEIIKIGSQLEEILNSKTTLKNSFPKIIKNYDFKNRKIEYANSENLSRDIEYIFELIRWAMPLIKEVVEEAIILYDFVDNNLKLEEVGILPLYKEEGYLIILNSIEKKWQVYKFESSLFSSNDEKFRAIKTRFLETIEGKIIESTPESIKLELIKRYNELPNPATFICGNELDFPFNESIFPIAKRKLMARVAA
jgi:hypothetical protein